MQEIRSFIQDVPQIVPEIWCLKCKICCRFPDTKEVQTPTWSSLEADWAVKAGGQASWFEKSPDSVSLNPTLHSCGERGYRCPAFQMEGSICSVYSVRPLDCRLYPFVLTRNPGKTEVLLAMDTKCPYIQAHGMDPEVVRYTAALTRYLESPAALDYLRTNPKIVGDFWPEFLSIAALGEMTADLQGQNTAPHPAIQPLGWPQRSLLEESLSFAKHIYSGYTAAGILGWSDLIHYGWASLEGAFCLFAQQGGGVFMPLPPLGRSVRPEAFDAAWKILSEVNQGSEVSRIEGIEPSMIPQEVLNRFRWREGEPEYLYRREELAALRGDRYRSQRGAVNRFQRRFPSSRFRPFQDQDLVPCLQLYTLWAIRRQQADPESFSKALVRDGLFFHRRLMMSHRELGLTGRVLEVEGQIRGYTFGAPVSSDLFCVFLEIADRSFPGTSQLLFLEFCKDLGNYPLINAMGDSGLPGLRRAKQAYRPVGMARVVELAGVEPAASAVRLQRSPN